VAVAFPSSLVAATPARRGGEPLSSPLLALSFVLRLLLLLVDREELGGAWGPMGITPVNIRFEAARARRVRPRVRER
jgi:hypothetical protein